VAARGVSGCRPSLTVVTASPPAGEWAQAFVSAAVMAWGAIVVLWWLRPQPVASAGNADRLNGTPPPARQRPSSIRHLFRESGA
jgi:hypothetical protein